MGKFLTLLLFLGLSLPVTRAAEPPMQAGAVVVAPLTGEVNEAQFFFLRRVLKHAESAHAAAFVLDMDTYGGSLPSAVKILGVLMKAGIPTITYVDTNAGSAGALIALSTQRIYMAPVSAIGAAAPVNSDGGDLQETMNAKVTSYFSGYFRSAAQKNGYSPELAEAFINKDREVKIGDAVINPKGSLLTLSAQEAIKNFNGKPLLAQGIAVSLEEVCREAGLAGHPIVRVEPSGFEVAAQWITALAPFFLLGGIIGAYLEFKAPGFGVAGVISAICFLLFFAGHYIAGLTGFEAAAVFVLGVAFVVIELMFFPGVTVLALTGIVLMFGAMLFAMVDFYPGRIFALSFDELLWPLLNLAAALALSAIAIALLARFFPGLPIFRRLVLAANSPAGPSAVPFADEATVKVGDEGVALSILRPAGKAKFGELLVDVMTEGDFFESGTPLRVKRIEGERVIVGVA